MKITSSLLTGMYILYVKSKYILTTYCIHVHVSTYILVPTMNTVLIKTKILAKRLHFVDMNQVVKRKIISLAHISSTAHTATDRGT